MAPQETSAIALPQTVKLKQKEREKKKGVQTNKYKREHTKMETA